MPPLATVDAGAQPSPAPGLDAAVAVVEPPAVDAGDELAPPPMDAGAITAPPIDDEPNLKFFVRTSGATFIVSNGSGQPWTDCVVTAPGQKRFKLGRFAAGSSRELARSAFRFDASALSEEHTLRIDCREGFGLAKLR